MVILEYPTKSSLHFEESDMYMTESTYLPILGLKITSYLWSNFSVA